MQIKIRLALRFYFSSDFAFSYYVYACMLKTIEANVVSIITPITADKGIYKQKKLQNFSSKIYPLSPKTTAINNLIWGYSNYKNRDI